MGECVRYLSRDKAPLRETQRASRIYSNMAQFFLGAFQTLDQRQHIARETDRVRQPSVGI
jgi:hypothetical protein